MLATLSTKKKLTEVQEILLNKRQHYSANFLDRQTGDANIYEALRYIFEGYLDWSPIQVRDCLTMDVVKIMKMEPLINRIPCPPELDRTRDLEYVAWHLYPETKNCNHRDLAIKVYHRLINGEISRFPKGYFDGTIKGWFRARCAFQCMLIEFMPPFENLDSLYAYFASAKGRDAIKKYKLLVPLRELYENPLDYLHDSLPPSQKDDELYKKYQNVLRKKSRNKKQFKEGDDKIDSSET